ncbi:hypothetical protein PUN28_005881 [Cardiocondyla obscurior]|uniref:Uncharacterized protein n=1 Tax=Cardiocondyla obscurior TaxID=286306 RepID=A0AAW2G899_9HYME
MRTIIPVIKHACCRNHLRDCEPYKKKRKFNIFHPRLPKMTPRAVTHARQTTRIPPTSSAACAFRERLLRLLERKRPSCLTAIDGQKRPPHFFERD